MQDPVGHPVLKFLQREDILPASPRWQNKVVVMGLGAEQSICYGFGAILFANFQGTGRASYKLWRDHKHLGGEVG